MKSVLRKPPESCREQGYEPIGINQNTLAIAETTGEPFDGPTGDPAGGSVAVAQSEIGTGCYLLTRRVSVILAIHLTLLGG